LKNFQLCSNVKDYDLKENLHVEAWDEDALSDDKIGRCFIPLVTLVKEAHVDDGHWFQLHEFEDHRKIAGYIRLHVVAEGKGFPGSKSEERHHPIAEHITHELEKKAAEQREEEQREEEKREAEKREAEKREAEKREAEQKEAEKRELEKRLEQELEKEAKKTEDKKEHHHETRLKCVHSGLYLDVAGVSKDDDAGLHQWTKTDGLNQVFVFKDQKDGTYEIIAKHSHKALTAVGEGDGSRLVQSSPTDAPTQRWHVKQNSDGSYTITNHKSGKVIDVEGPSKDVGHKVHLWKDLNNDNQHWLPDDPLPLDVLDGKTTRIVAKHSGKALDVSEVSQANGAKVWQWEKHDGPNQKWTFHANGGGTYTISVKHSGKFLTVHGTDNGSLFVQEDKSGKEDQVFEVTKNPDGSYRISNAHSKKSLDVDGNAQENGHKIHQWDPHNGDNQKWLLIDL